MSSELIVRIGANSDKYREELEKVQKTTKNLEKDLAQIGKISAVAFTAGAVAIGGAVIAANKFEEKFTDVVTLLDDASFSTKTLEQGIAGLKKGVLELGQATGENFDDLNQALFDLISAGVPAEEAMDTLRVTTELAAAGATETSIAVKALTSTMTAFGDEAGTAQEISEKFFTAQKFGVTTVGELAREFNKVAGLANNMGVSFDEALASLSALTADGAKPTAEAATQLKAAFNGIINIQKELGKESQQVQEALSLQNIEQKGLVGALTELKEATGGSVVEMKRLLGSSEALQAVLSLTGAQSALVKKQMKEMADESARAATFADALAVKQATGARAMARFSKVIETAAILLGDQFAPLISKAADALSGLFRIFNDNPILIKFSALILGAGTALAAIAGAGALAATAFLQVRAAMLALNISTKVLSIGIKGLVGATGLGLLLIVAGEIYANWEVIWPAMSKTFKKFFNDMIPLIEGVSNFFIDGFNLIIGGAIKFGKAYVAIWKGIIDTVIGVATGVGNILLGVFTLDTDKIKEGVEGAKKAIVDGTRQTISDVKKEITKDTDPLILPVKLEAFDTKEEVKKGDVKAENVKSDVVVADEVSTGQASIDKKVLEDKKKLEADKTQILSDEQKNRIAVNKNAIALIQAAEKKASDQELGFIKRRQDLAFASEKAAAEKNNELRESDQDLIRAQREELLAEEKVYFARKKEQDLMAKEEKNALQKEFNELTKEEQALFNEEELEAIQENILTKQELDTMVAEEKLGAAIERRNQFLVDEKKHGTTVARLNQFLASSEVLLAKQSANQLVALTQSKNETLKGIGKAAAASQIAIDTAAGAASIFAKLNALFPILAPGIGIAGAVAISAFGAEKTANVLAANTGGLVPRNAGIAGRDSVQALLTPGELVVPEKNFDEVVASVAANRSVSPVDRRESDDQTSGVPEIDVNIEINPTGDLMDFIEQQIIKRRVQGVSLL